MELYLLEEYAVYFNQYPARYSYKVHSYKKEKISNLFLKFICFLQAHWIADKYDRKSNFALIGNKW